MLLVLLLSLACPALGSRAVASEDESGQSRRLPGALVIGVKKSGTRALVEYLRLRPDLRPTGPELHFFDRNYQRGLDWYRAQMPLSGAGQLTVEKTAGYWASKESPQRVRSSLGPAVRLLVVVRDPVTRALSDYAQTASKRPGLPPFARMAFRDDGSVNASWGGVRLGVYHRPLRRWLAHFPRDALHFVDGDRLVSHPYEEMRAVEAFLRLPPFLQPQHFVFNATKGFPCLRALAQPAAEPHCLGPTKGRPHPALSGEELRKLRDFFRPHNQRFYRLVARDFGW